MLYEALTGHVPFEKATLFELMRAHLEDAPPPLRSWRADVPAAIEAVVAKALAKRPEQRFATALDMAEALRVAASGMPASQFRPLSSRGGERSSGAQMAPHVRMGVATTVAASPVARSRGWKLRVAAIALGIAAVMFGVAVVWQVTSGGKAEPTVVAESPSPSPVTVSGSGSTRDTDHDADSDHVAVAVAVHDQAHDHDQAHEGRKYARGSVCG